MFMDQKNQYSENQYIPKPIHKFSAVPIKLFRIHLEPDILECEVKWVLLLLLLLSRFSHVRLCATP